MGTWSPVQWVPGLLYNGYLVFFSEMEQPGRDVDHPPSSSAEVKERVEIRLTLAAYKQPVIVI